MPGRLVLLLLAVPALLSSCGPLRHQDRTNILLIIVDTLRADHLGCYGYSRARTPNMDALASEGAIFRTVVTAAPVTAPSVATILTSTSPGFHGVRDNEAFGLDPDLPTMASALRGAGYSTACFVSSVVLHERHGFAGGFDRYGDEMQESYRAYSPAYASQEVELRGTQRRADHVTAEAVEWLEEREGEGPFLCVVHYFDPHDPYDPPPPYDKVSGGSPYDGEISFTDSQVGLLLAKLAELDLDGNTLVLLTADHGEGLGEHMERTHGFFLYDSTVLVPLIARLPGAIRPGLSFSSQVRTIDIMPTALDLAGVPAPGTAQGVSLAPALLERREPGDMTAYLETYHTRYSYDWHELEGLRTPRWKYVCAPEPELYDLATDGGELHNIVDAEPAIASRMKASLAALQEELHSGASSYRASRLEKDKDIARKMRALGYLGRGSPGGRASGRNLPDPKDEIARLNARQEAGGRLRMAMVLLGRGDFEGALKRVEEAARIAPDYAEVSATKGLILTRMGEAGRGIELLEAALEKDPGSAMAHQTLNNLGLAYLQAGRCEEAIEALDKSLSLKKDYYNAMYNLGLAHETCGNNKEALRAYKFFLESSPRVDDSLLLSLRTKISSLRKRVEGGGPGDEEVPRAAVGGKSR